jgi:hypothetical protein
MGPAGVSDDVGGRIPATAAQNRRPMHAIDRIRDRSPLSPSRGRAGVSSPARTRPALAPPPRAARRRPPPAPTPAASAPAFAATVDELNRRCSGVLLSARDCVAAAGSAAAVAGFRPCSGRRPFLLPPLASAAVDCCCRGVSPPPPSRFRRHPRRGAPAVDLPPG